MDKHMDKHKEKIAHFLLALQDCYKDEEKKDSISFRALKLCDEEITDDFYAIIEAFFLFYKKITDDNNMDLIGFTHMLNRLVFQNQIERFN